jgi:hypothetical protein
MNMNDEAKWYLDTFYSHGEFPGGLSFAKALGQCKLDGTFESLDRVDQLLDQIRTQLKPEFNAFLSVRANQNFLYFLCFYVGYVITKASGKAVRWLSYRDMLAEIPDNRQFFPECFQTSVTCITPVSFFVPLHSISMRLFEEVTTKSVRLSAQSNCGAPASA